MQNRQSGFTLLEILLAIVLLSMVMAMAYSGMRAVTKSMDRADKLIQEQTRVRATQQFLQRQLASTLPMVFSSEEGSDPIVFEGADDYIRFVAPMPGYLGSGGPHVQQISLEPAGRGYELIFRHAPLMAYDDEIWQDAEPFVLMGGIERAEFAMIGFDDEGRISDWQSDWEEVAKVPLALSLDIEMIDEVQVKWPVFNAVTRIDTSIINSVYEDRAQFMRRAIEASVNQENQQ